MKNFLLQPGVPKYTRELAMCMVLRGNGPFQYLKQLKLVANELVWHVWVLFVLP